MVMGGSEVRRYNFSVRWDSLEMQLLYNFKKTQKLCVEDQGFEPRRGLTLYYPRRIAALQLVLRATLYIIYIVDYLAYMYCINYFNKSFNKTVNKT